MHALLSNLANRQTERQMNVSKRILPPPLWEVIIFLIMPSHMVCAAEYMFSLFRCVSRCPVRTWTRPHDGRVHDTSAVTEASYVRDRSLDL